MLHVLKNELYKSLRLKKIYMFMIMIVLVEILFLLQIKLGDTNPEAPIVNGLSFPMLLFVAIPYLMVIFTAVFIADSWVDEYRSGVFKLMLTRPIERTTLLNAKIGSYFICCTLMMLFTLGSSYLAGSIALGWGESTIINGEQFTVWTSLALTLKSGFVTLLPVFSFGLMVMFIGLYTDTKGTTIGTALGILIASQMLESSALREYSIIYLIQSFYKNLFFTFTGDMVLKNIFVIASHVILFYTGSIILFKKKNLVA